MRQRPLHAWVTAILALTMVLGARAHAQDAAAGAEASFEQGHKLMGEGKYADACTAFERSQKLDPQLGTRYNIGVCSEKQGKTASAWTAFREVAQRDTNPGRRADATKRAAALAPKLTKLLVNAAASPVDFAVRVNGTDATNLLGIETPVDPGSYTVVASAPGFKDWSTTVRATGEGQTVTVAIPALEHGPPGPPTRSEPGKATTTIEHLETTTTEPAPSGGRKKVGLAVGATGVAITIGGAIAGVMARGKWNDAKAVCGGQLTCPTDAETAQANALGDAARTRANLATGLVGVGVVAIGVGAALYFTAHGESSHGVAIIPAAAPDGVSVTIGGRF